jgi:hypothetical protein
MPRITSPIEADEMVEPDFKTPPASANAGRTMSAV